MGLLIIFDYRSIVRALRNMASNVKSGGILVFDYNFTTYNEPREVVVRARGRVYRSIMRWEDVEPIDGGVMYRYKIEVLDEKGNLVGVEDTGYPVYSRETLLKAIEEAGLELVELRWATWDPERYMYKFLSREADSAFLALRVP